jgi:NADH:ubiquinone oxidoreductase subunit 6 (subunit J)
MGKRKQVLIDKKFQLGTTFSIIQVVLVIFAVLVAVIAGTAVYNNHRLEGTVLNQKQVLTGQYNAFSTLLVLTRTGTCTLEQLNDASNKMMGEVDRSMSMSSSNINTIESIITGNYVLIFSILGIIIIQGAVLFIIIVRKTHRIIGPAKLMVRHMNDIMEGREPSIRPLREGDELQELYDTFGRFVKHAGKGGQ